MAARLNGRTRLPLLDSLACAIVQAEAMIHLRVGATSVVA
jgi:hypothetical protein